MTDEKIAKVFMEIQYPQSWNEIAKLKSELEEKPLKPGEKKKKSLSACV